MTLLLDIALAGLLAQAVGPGAQAGWASPATEALTKAIAIQVALDRAGFSPGVIDGQMGANTRRAMRAYEQQHGNPVEPVALP